MKSRRKLLRSSRYAAVALGASLILANTIAAGAAAYATSSGRPAPIRGLNLLTGRLGASSSGQLSGVFCVSLTNCWAVGDTLNNGAELNQVLHWTGKHWFKVAVPNPGGSGHNSANQLMAVRCTSASNCWAVGAFSKGQAELDQALHYNGKKWSAVATPKPARLLKGELNVLSDVTCTSARSCWAVGFHATFTSTTTGESALVLNQVLHWNGKHWSLVHAPNPGGLSPDDGSALFAVRCASASNCWASGTFGTSGLPVASAQSTLRNQMLHWNGKKWAKQTVPSPGGTAQSAINVLDGLACASPTNCWAAGVVGMITGIASTTKLLNEVLHWNGRKWREQHVPNPGGGAVGSENALDGITCSSARNCWAVGSASTAAATLNEAVRWNGTKWSLFKTPDPGGTGLNILNGVRCTSAANCWAVGFSDRPHLSEKNQILHWTGRKWFVG